MNQPLDLHAVIRALQLPADAVEPRGHGVVKVDPQRIARSAKPGRVVLVTAMTPTPAGEGKTTTTIGLVDGLRRVGVKAIGALREPSLGPLFGVKGGAVGGGLARIVPDDAINLHFTGDLHAVTAAHNLLAAMVENHDVTGATPKLARITWGRVLDMNDRGLRQVDVGHANKKPYRSRFDITAASEVMAILCLSKDVPDLRARLDRIVVGEGEDGTPVTAKDVRAAGAMAAILLDACRPNLVQTLEGNPVLVHGGPFANVAQGTSTLMQTKLAQQLGDVVVTEAGFAFDLGGFKFLDIKCRAGGIMPAAVVLVGTIRALRCHGASADYHKPDVAAVKRGVENLLAHADAMERLGLPKPTLSLNRFPDDQAEEIKIVEDKLGARGIVVVSGEYFARGGAGAEALAHEVMKRLREDTTDAPQYRAPYALTDALPAKIEQVAKTVLGATGIVLTEQAKSDLALVEKLGGGGLPICLAKTHLSISDQQKLLGRPPAFTLTVSGLRLSAGAGFVVVLCGPVVTMPGLPAAPQAWNIDIAADAHGNYKAVGIK
jgi:formate--tetrahydrofolate ligase